MVRPNDPINVRLISKVSSLYYHQNLTQQEIAKRFQISRPKVSRLLKQGRLQGIVKINIQIPSDSFVEQETFLEKKFGLKEVVITDITPDHPNLNMDISKQQLGMSAAHYLQRSISDNDIIGVSWGTTLQAMIDQLQPIPVKNAHVVQLLGGIGPPEAKAHASDISRRLSQILNSRLTLLPAPGIVETADAKSILLSDKRVKNALSMFSKINKAYVGIGALATNSVLQQDNQELPARIRSNILKSSVIGDIGLNFFNCNGKEVHTGFQDLFIGMSLKQFKKVETVVGIAGGTDKFEAIVGTLRGGYVNVLITDSTTANGLINL